MENSYIKLYRGLLDWEWFNDSKMVHLFIFFLIKANYADSRYRGQKVLRGQLVTGLDSLQKQTSMSLQSLRTCMERLQSTGEITVQSTNRFSLVTVVKYDVYQGVEKKSTNKQQTNNKQITTSKEEEEERRIYFQKSKIFEKNRFMEEFPDWNKTKLAYYHAAALRYSNEGNKYIDWAAAIRSWAKKDELQGKIKFENITATKLQGLI